VTIQEAKTKTKMLIDNYSISGTLIADTNKNQKDYLFKMPHFFDTAQKEIAQVKPIRKTHRISQNLPPNLLTRPFEIIPFCGTDLIYSVGSAYGYSFAVDDPATVYVEYEYPKDVWNEIEAITHTEDGQGYRAYKGVILNPANALAVRLRFTGASYYNTKNRALYDVRFSSAARVPECQPFMLYAMPSDFYKLGQVIQKGNAWTNDAYKTPLFYWEHPKTLAIDCSYAGDFAIEYHAMPKTIDGATAETAEFEVDTESQEAIPIYAAAMCLQHENDRAYHELYAMYQGKLLNLDANTGGKPKAVVNSLFTNTRPKLF